MPKLRKRLLLLLFTGICLLFACGKKSQVGGGGRQGSGTRAEIDQLLRHWSGVRKETLLSYINLNGSEGHDCREGLAAGLPSYVVTKPQVRPATCQIVVSDSGEPARQGPFTSLDCGVVITGVNACDPELMKELDSPRVGGDEDSRWYSLGRSWAVLERKAAQTEYRLVSPKGRVSYFPPSKLLDPTEFDQLTKMYRSGWVILLLGFPEGCGVEPRNHFTVIPGNSLSDSYAWENVGRAPRMTVELPCWRTQFRGKDFARLYRLNPKSGRIGDMLGYAVQVHQGPWQAERPLGQLSLWRIVWYGQS